MRLKNSVIRICMFLVTLTALSGFISRGTLALGKNEQNSSATEFITVEELKTRLTKNQSVTIIDVRGNNGLLESDSKIKGAMHVNLRKLKSRLALPPLKDVPRDREIVTYCACPSDEASIRAAEVLRDAGFKRVRVLKGGWVDWKKAKGPIESIASGM